MTGADPGIFSRGGPTLSKKFYARLVMFTIKIKIPLPEFSKS
jgi:hypothetical protein